MRRRDVAAWVGCLALLGPADSRAQAPAGANRAEHAKLRAEVIRLRTEVEMLQLDFDLARADLLEDLKLIKGMAMAGDLMSAFGGARASAGRRREGARGGGEEGAGGREREGGREGLVRGREEEGAGQAGGVARLEAARPGRRRAAVSRARGRREARGRNPGHPARRSQGLDRAAPRSVMTTLFDLDAGVATVSELTARIKSTLERRVRRRRGPRRGLGAVAAEVGARLFEPEGRRRLPPLRPLAEHGPARPVRAARRAGRARLGEHLALRAAGRLPAHRRPRRARGDRRARARLPPDVRPARGRGVVRPRAETPSARVPPADRRRHQPDRRGGPRLPPGRRPPLVGVGDPHRPGQGPGPGRGRGGRRGDRIGEPRRRGRPRDRRPGAAGASRTSGRSTRRSSRGRSWPRPCPSSRPSGTRST